jgi:hypothetical protein
MPFHVHVEAHPDEASRVTSEQVLAGRAWLRRHVDAGTITATGAWTEDDGTPRTGGFMLVDVPDRPALDAFMADYPLLDTIDAVGRRYGELDPGFAVLLADVDARQGASA